MMPFSPVVNIRDLEDAVVAAGRGTRLLPSRRRQIEAYQFLLDSWPGSVRRCVRRFATSQWHLIQFVNRCGVWAEQLLWSNPALGFLAANIVPVSPDCVGEHSIEAHRHHLLGMKRRIIAARFGFAGKESIVRLLGRVPAGWVSVDLLEGLRSLLGAEGPAASLLAYMPRINPLIVEIARDPEIRSMFSFECLRQVSMIDPSVVHCDAIGRIKEVALNARWLELRLPHFNQLSDFDRRPTPPPSTTVRRQRPWTFPPPPLAESEAIQAIRTHADLKAEGTLMRHCVGTNLAYVNEIVSGSLFFYRMLEPERATICIRKVDERWMLSDVRGPANRSVQSATLISIDEWLWSAQRTAPPIPYVQHRIQPVDCSQGRCLPG